jgi:hypothetical protein
LGLVVVFGIYYFLFAYMALVRRFSAKPDKLFANAE